jgi:hypothetical protein
MRQIENHVEEPRVPFGELFELSGSHAAR